MEPNDELDPDGSRDRLLPPDDRLWRHPSEVASAGGARGGAPAAATAVETPSSPPEGRMWTVAILSGVIGALLATGRPSTSRSSAGTVTWRVRAIPTA